jgi:hypothetical protein
MILGGDIYQMHT